MVAHMLSLLDVHFDLAGSYGCLKGGVVALGLVGISESEISHGFIEGIAYSHQLQVARKKISFLLFIVAHRFYGYCVSYHVR